jgi:hypothetical protein
MFNKRKVSKELADKVSVVKKMSRLILIFSAMLASLTCPALGQDLTPRAYWPAPKGTQVLTVGYIRTDGDTLPDPSLPITGVDSKIDTFVLGYLNTMDLWGRTAHLILELPYSEGTTSLIHEKLGKVSREYQGVGDIAATLSVNFVGAPSMDMKGFADLRRYPRPIIGGSLKLVAPTGKYDTERIINVGANRWAARAQLGTILPLSPKWLAEIALGAWVFDDNDDFRGVTKKQDPVASAEVHLVRRFSPGFWVSLDGTYYRGGRSEIDGEDRDDLQRDSRIGATLVYPLASGHLLKLAYTMGSVSDSDEDFDFFSIAYQRLF